MDNCGHITGARKEHTRWQVGLADGQVLDHVEVGAPARECEEGLGHRGRIPGLGHRTLGQVHLHVHIIALLMGRSWIMLRLGPLQVKVKKGLGTAWASLGMGTERMASFTCTEAHTSVFVCNQHCACVYMCVGTLSLQAISRVHHTKAPPGSVCCSHRERHAADS